MDTYTFYNEYEQAVKYREDMKNKYTIKKSRCETDMVPLKSIGSVVIINN